MRGLALAWLLAGSGCATVIPPAVPAEPLAVFLLDHGRSTSLVLPGADGPGADGGAVRYAYGDWVWYALGRTGSAEGSAALLWPTRAALGRRALPGPPTAEAVRRQVAVPIERLHEIVVGAPAVHRLRGALEAIHRDETSPRVYNRAADLEFAHHPRPYTALHNSNRVVADWLRALGCEVRGPALLAAWRVRAPPATPAGSRAAPLPAPPRAAGR